MLLTKILFWTHLALAQNPTFIEQDLNKKEQKIYSNFKSTCDILNGFSKEYSDSSLDKLKHEEIYALLRKVFTLKQLVINSIGYRFNSCNKLKKEILDEINQFEERLILSKNGEKQKDLMAFNSSIERNYFTSFAITQTSKYPMGDRNKLEEGDIILISRINSVKLPKISKSKYQNLFSEIGLIKIKNNKLFVTFFNQDHQQVEMPIDSFVLSDLYSYWILKIKDEEINRRILKSLNNFNPKTVQDKPFINMQWYLELLKFSEPVIYKAIRQNGSNCAPKITHCEWNYPFDLVYSGYFQLKNTWTYWPGLTLKNSSVPAEQ